jgi:tRNA (guanine-N7-)-methyltransferase
VRQRVVKNKEEIMLQCRRWVVGDAALLKGGWRQAFTNPGPLYLEIGCGKGQFITGLARKEPSCNFIAAEGGENIVIRTLQKAHDAALENLLVIPGYIADPELLFEKGELSGIYINFCDPWPKERHARRRLTHRDLLKKYRLITEPEGVLAFKTDNQELFDFSLEEFQSTGLKLLKMTRDLHHSEYAAGNTSTEYEDKFAAMGKPIFYALVSLSNE